MSIVRCLKFIIPFKSGSVWQSGGTQPDLNDCFIKIKTVVVRESAQFFRTLAVANSFLLHICYR
jgi:hypothetical protein